MITSQHATTLKAKGQLGIINKDLTFQRIIPILQLQNFHICSLTSILNNSIPELKKERDQNLDLYSEILILVTLINV